MGYLVGSSKKPVWLRHRRITMLRSLFHLLKFDPSASKDSTAVLYLMGSHRNLVFADVSVEWEAGSMEELAFLLMEGVEEWWMVDFERWSVINWE